MFILCTDLNRVTLFIYELFYKKTKILCTEFKFQQNTNILSIDEL